jgi:hypothetical protein
MHGGKTNVIYRMFDFTGNKWSYWNNNKRLKEKFATILGKHSIDSPQNTTVLRTSHTTNGKYCSLKLEPRAVKINFGSRAEESGRKYSDKR